MSSDFENKKYFTFQNNCAMVEPWFDKSEGVLIHWEHLSFFGRQNNHKWEGRKSICRKM